MLKALCICAASAIAGTAAAAPIVIETTNARPEIVLVAGGCGIGFHPNPFGVCVPNRRLFFGPGPVVVGPGRLPPPCPYGYHRDPDPARPLCYPNV